MAGADGAIRMLDPATPGLLEASQPRYQRFKPGHPSGFIEAFANLYCDFYSSIINHMTDQSDSNQYVKSLDHAVNGLVILDRLHKSAKTKTCSQI